MTWTGNIGIKVAVPKNLSTNAALQAHTGFVKAVKEMIVNGIMTLVSAGGIQSTSLNVDDVTVNKIAVLSGSSDQKRTRRLNLGPGPVIFKNMISARNLQLQGGSSKTKKTLDVDFTMKPERML